MSKLLLIFTLVFTTAIVGCSSSGEKSSDEVEAEWGDDEFEDNEVAEDSSDDLDSDDDFDEEDDRAPSSVGSLSIDEQQEYIVEKGDTLMQISFKLFGDISKWKAIAELNPGADQMLISGKKIKVPVAESPFVWQPVGLPYIIQTGDTLGTISKDKYGTPSKWQKIYNNNKPLIKDPNKIYAGFTIYYEEEEAMSAL